MDIKILIILFVTCSAEAFKVLLVYPMPLRSLNSLGVGFVRHLLEAGHEVTFVTPFPLKKNRQKKFREIDVSGNVQAFWDSVDVGRNIAVIIENPQLITDIRHLQDSAYRVAKCTFENNEVQKLLKDPNEHFDVVIADLYESELYAAFAAAFNCPMIWSYSMGLHWMTLRLVDEVTNPAYAGDYLSTDIPPLDFYQRLKKLWLQIKWSYIKWAETMPKEKAAYKKTFEPIFKKRGRSLPDYDVILYNASLVLANDFKGNGLMPNIPQNVRFIGGFHIELPLKALPDNIRTILDNAQHGFVYFSMGSEWQSKDLPKSILNGLLKVFGELRQTVIWKFEEVLPDLPKNVHILKWAPQTSILAHPKCLFFITHGGHLSSIESIHFGIPIIGVPIYFDQFININKAVNNGYAIKVDLNLDLPTNLNNSINKMLTSTTYKAKAMEYSFIYHNRPLPPGKELVHWVEHVVKTDGASHLRSPALMLPWYQKMYIDLATIVLIVFIIVLTTLRLVRFSNKVKCDKKLN